jgi:hypothetical protein
VGLLTNLLACFVLGVIVNWELTLFSISLNLC